MKYISFLLLCLFVVSSAASASSPVTPETIPSQTLGQNQYYSVVFDAEGEAAVAAKLTFENTTETALSEISFEIPGTSVRIINTVEEVSKTQKCLRYDYSGCEPDSSGKESCAYPCLQYGYDYPAPNYYLLTPRSEQLSSSMKVTIPLIAAVRPQEQFSILLYYKAEGYADKKLGVFKFSFETVKIPYDVQSVRVAINVQEGLSLAGGGAETNYRPNFSAVESVALPAAGAPDASLNDFSQRIIYEQGFVKQTSGLDPWESFSVDGKYASNSILLALPVLLNALIGIAVVAVVVWFVFKKMRRVMIQKRVSSTLTSQTFFGTPWVQASAAGFGVAFITAVFSLLLVWFGENINRYVSYGAFSGLFTALMFLSLIGFNLLVFFGVPLFFLRKYRWPTALLTLTIELGALFVLSLLFLLLLNSFSGNYPVPLY
ncbi:MAG: hypothetical protein A2806_00655 [Candidatus Terrybacteria bacterium RIFCSPHIGHO2_01_FULL_48_17]|uniref:Uncharacterized protein n=1 Tax=Candidatus Terrybacteria bacterium RIFCSPHIGHO2_01_FULL_48_17 TaxID=1802362 RepID=A0A1G2PIH4_9BACT|nr:MAG: hypothetical protein A2806_00655 [Candidatus Terrybacteria bacterium RIFCSPHIGHO2_01_FULL_48_17]OHA53851.1 MAG: hypothetical protein A3A30_01255 [Candidatus Terrybacteria bacterium RIFCSPLOWO2_01_FULL_48_14]